MNQNQQMRDSATVLLRDAGHLLDSVERAGRDLNNEEELRFKSILQRANRLQAKAEGRTVENDWAATKLYRCMRYLAANNGNAAAAEDVARRANDPEVALIIRASASAADTSTSGWAAELVTTVLGEFIPLLRARSALFTLAPNPIQWGPSDVKLPRGSTGSATGFIAEGAPIPVKQNALDSITVAAPKKAGSIIVASSELYRYASRYAESFIVGSLADDIALGADSVFLSNAASTAAAPAGLFHSSNGATAISATAGGTAAACAADLVALLTAGTAFTAPKLLIHPTAIATALGLSGASNYPIITALATGRIGRVEIIEASNMPAVDTIALIDADGLITGSDGLRIDVSTYATLEMETAPNADILVPASGGANMFQRDMVATAVKMGLTWRSQRTAQVQRVTGATWV